MDRTPTSDQYLLELIGNTIQISLEHYTIYSCDVIDFGGFVCSQKSLSMAVWLNLCLLFAGTRSWNWAA